MSFVFIKFYFITGYDLVKLPEDSALAGFTPLMYNIQELVYAKADTELVNNFQT